MPVTCNGTEAVCVTTNGMLRKNGILVTDKLAIWDVIEESLELVN